MTGEEVVPWVGRRTCRFTFSSWPSPASMAPNPLTSTFLDDTVPAASELPSFEVSNTQTDSLRNPLGAKGIGESGTIGSTPAIQNAVVDALSHLGVVHVDMACTPERVWNAIQDARVPGMAAAEAVPPTTIG